MHTARRMLRAKSVQCFILDLQRVGRDEILQPMQRRLLLSGYRQWNVITLLVLVAVFLPGCLFLESSFVLSPESRLPKWLEPPANVPRSELIVTMDCYSSGKDVFKMKRRGHPFFQKKLAVYSGENDSSVVLIGQEARPYRPFEYPRYRVVTANGVTDIIEHRAMEPVFYMVDDPEVWKKLGVTSPD